MTIPEVQKRFHEHDGQRWPVTVMYFHHKPTPGEEPRFVEAGENCALCGFTESLVAERMHIEAIMGWAATEVEVSPPRELLCDEDDLAG
jgi:hypothetical protein